MLHVKVRRHVAVQAEVMAFLHVPDLTSGQGIHLWVPRVSDQTPRPISRMAA